MRFIPPWGSSDPNASYVDRNTPGAVSGSRVPAAAIENPMREIMAVIDAAGIDPSDADLTQLLQAINQLISAATGGAGDPNYVLMTQARVRLPIFPEVLTSDGRIPVVSPSSGQVRLPAGYNLLHRGIFVVTTTLLDFVTSANKTYHLRWSPNNGFQLKDLADVAYNPAGLSEENAIFDSGFDDVLIARAVSNAGNNVAVLNLANKDRLSLSNTIGINATVRPGSDVTGIELNLARTPRAAIQALDDVRDSNSGGEEVDHGVRPASRYGLSAWYRRSVLYGGSADNATIGWIAWL
jgi:hypothetical protein